MSWFIVCWIVSGILAGGTMGLLTWYGMKTGEIKQVLLTELLLGFLLCIVPVVNALAFICLVTYFFSEIAPKIVIMEKK